MKYVVAVADSLNERGLELLRNRSDFEVISTAGGSDKLPKVLKSAHALIVRSETKVTGELLAGAPHLRVIGRAGIGVDNIDIESATRRGIAVLNAPGANTVSAAEHAVALLLTLLRRIPWAAESMRRGEWDRTSFSGTELRGKVLGVVGLGRVGARVSAIAGAFGMTTLADDPYLSEDTAREYGVELLPLDEVLSRADVLTLHLPLSAETRNLIDKRRLALMKPSAVIVNTARGGLIDEVALVEAVESGRLAGAALDVFVDEPLQADSPLRSTERIILTPHLGASTVEAQERVAVEICESVLNALTTGDVGGAVNLPGEALAELRPLLELTRRAGCLAAAIVRGHVEQVEFHYGSQDDDVPKTVVLAAVEGVLSAMGVEPVNLVNAMVLADERGISVGRHIGEPQEGFETTVAVTVKTADRDITVLAALLGEKRGRIVGIDGFEVDLPPEGYVLVLRNRDVPGVIGSVGTVLGRAGINIGSYHQSRRFDSGAEPQALAAISVDQAPDRSVIEELESVEDVLEVRLADLSVNS